MYVRLAFAVAAHLEPEILMVDEVLAVGDAQFQKKCLGKMEDVSKEGRTLFFVSHNLAAVQSLCNRGFVLHQGTMLLDGQTEKAVTFYLQKSGADLMSGSMSLLERRDRKGNGKARVVSLTLYSQEGIETNSIGMGEDLSVTLEIEGKLKNAVIGILIGNLFMRQICRGYTYESYSGKIDINGSVIIKCHFREIPLVQGVYYIHTWVGGIAGECADEVDNAMELHIIEKDVFNTGKKLDRKGNLFFVKHEWNFS
jgi:lipopolysaccharide transport system ATP-binding protein